MTDEQRQCKHVNNNRPIVLEMQICMYELSTKSFEHNTGNLKYCYNASPDNTLNN